jgi:iron-sulfur cluster assembly protein
MWNEKTFECDSNEYTKAVLLPLETTNLGGSEPSSRLHAHETRFLGGKLPPMLTLSDSAIDQIRQLVSAKSAAEALGLRIDVEKGGCAGYQYVMKISSQMPSDTSVDRNGIQVFISEAGVPFLQGCHLDFVDSLSDGGFRVENPNASRSCGCGTSFEPRGNTTETSV